MQQRQGCTYLVPNTTYIRLSDIIFEWCKPLPPWHVNALKSLVNPQALLHPAHPLQVPAATSSSPSPSTEPASTSSAPAPGSGLAVFAGVVPGGKTRLYMSLRQVEYLRYYIHTLNLIDPTSQEVEKWRKRCKEEGVEPSDWFAGDDGEGLRELDELRRLPLPDSGWWIRQEELVDVISVTIATEDEFKRAMKNAASVYQKTKAALLVNHTKAAEVVADADAGPVLDDQAPSATIAERMTTTTVAEDVVAPAVPAPPAPLHQHPRQRQNPEDPESTFDRAEASYPLSHTYIIAAPPSQTSQTNNPGAWLSVDFQVWENEYGVVLDVGWAGKWFVPSALTGDNGAGGWVEKTDGGHWIVQENERKRNTAKVVPNNGKIEDDGGAPIPYMYGERKSEVLPLEAVKEKVRALIPLMRERGGGGPVHLIVHAAERHLASTRLLGLDIVPLHDEPGYASVRARATKEEANAKAGAPESEKVVVFDTSTLLAAVANANSLTAHPLVLPIQTSNWSLERLAQVLLGGGDALRGGPGIGRVDRNSGNRAAVTLECFSTMVVAGIESLQPIFANSEPSVAVTSNTTVLAGAITENAAEFANADPVQPSDWDLDLRARADLQDRKLTADAAAATQTGAHRGENVNTDEIGLRVFTPPTEVQTRVAQGWSHIAPPTGAAAVAYGANAHAQEEDRGEAEEDMMDEEEAFQQLIDELGDMEPEVGRFGPDWEGDSDDE